MARGCKCELMAEFMKGIGKTIKGKGTGDSFTAMEMSTKETFWMDKLMEQGLSTVTNGVYIEDNGKKI